METAIKVIPTLPTSFNVYEGHANPTQKDCKTQLTSSHPIQQSEEKYDMNRHCIDMHFMAKHQGLAAPLKLSMELTSVRKIGRLPFLASSNALQDSLTGRDLGIDFSDFLGTPEFSEFQRQPHIVVEKQLGIL